MKKLSVVLVLVLGVMTTSILTAQNPETLARTNTYTIVIHGGAGTIPESMPDSIKQGYYDGLKKALNIGKDAF